MPRPLVGNITAHIDLLRIHGGQALFDFRARLAQGSTEITVVMFAGNKRGVSDYDRAPANKA